MAKREILKNEQRLNDIFLSLFDNIKESVRKREENSVWGPYKLTSNAKIYSQTKLQEPFSSAVVETHNAECQRDIWPANTQQTINCDYSSTSDEISEFHQCNNTHNEDNCIKISTVCGQSVTNNTKMRKRVIGEGEKMENTQKIQATGSEKKSGALPSIDFQNWCLERNKHFQDSNLKDSHKSSSARFDVDKSNVLNEDNCIRTSSTGFDQNFTSIGKQVFSEDEKIENTSKTLTTGSKKKSDLSLVDFQSWCLDRWKYFENSNLKDSYKNTHARFGVDQCQNQATCSEELMGNLSSCENCQPPTTKNFLIEGKSENLRGMRKFVESERKEKSSEVKDIRKVVCEKKDSSVGLEKSLVCIKLTDENRNQSYEFVAKLADVTRVRRLFPKLSQVMPNVDSESCAINYCFDAVKVILKYLFHHRYKFDIANSLTNVEVLAAARSWKMSSFYQKFVDDFLQKELVPSKISRIFSRANQFGLTEVCDACESLALDQIDLDYPFAVQKFCFLTVSSYIEPSEYCIPFNPIEINMKSSFERRIKNQIVFEAISGCYHIIGFQVQLNDSCIKKMSNSNCRLKIDYNVKNSATGQVLYDQRTEKPLRPVNIVYFNKALVINASQSGIINVEMDVKPYLCSALKEMEIKVRKRKSVGEFQLLMDSDFILKESNEKVFIIGKLFFHKK